MNFICNNISAENGRLYFAGQDTVALAEQYGTPLFLMDEARIRHNCRVYLEAFKENFGGNSLPLYASKANSFKQIYRIAGEEGMGIDVVSSGEIYTASEAGFDMSKAYFHSNNKTNEDICFAMDRGVGHFVVDNVEELERISQMAASRGITQKILIRVTPGIDTHTYEAINTGKVDSKFGAAIETGQAESLIALALKAGSIKLEGLHCHIGSQVFTEDVFERAVVVMMSFIVEISKKYGYLASVLNLGGGYGVRYVESDPVLDIPSKIAQVAAVLKETCGKFGVPVPTILMEPGRSIVADAGMTLYTAGTVKKIPGYKNYVSVDGGMTDNPRFALYGAQYTVLPAGRMDEAADMECSLVGRCCESGDIIEDHAKLPADTCRGDIIAVCTTGAYCYSMASNYNRIARPPIVMLNEGESYVAVKRETLEDLARLDV